MKIEPNKIILADCLEVMEDIADGSVDAIICDLPYEVLHKNNPHAKWDRKLPTEMLWAHYERIIKDNGAIILFGQGMFTAELMMSNPKLWRYNLVWDKMRSTGFLNANRMPLRCHEDILVFYRQMPVYHPQMTVGDPNHPRGNQPWEQDNHCYGKYKNGNTTKKVAPTRPNEKFPTSIIRIAKEHETTVFHPTQKPVDLLRWLIRTYTDKGDVVLDNTMGSGTACVASIIEGRRYIGIEKDPKYFEIAKKRIEEQERQMKFDFEI